MWDLSVLQKQRKHGESLTFIPHPRHIAREEVMNATQNTDGASLHESLPAGYIRLLRLKDAASDGETDPSKLRCEILTVALSNCPDYVALSYRWGDPGHQKMEVECSEKCAESVQARSEPSLKTITDASSTEIQSSTDTNCQSIPRTMVTIPGNLYNLLSRLQDLKCVDLFWADAICINQNNVAEMNEQIRAMSQIYQTARLVLSWTGQCPNGFRKTMPVFERLMQVFRPLMPEDLRWWRPQYVASNIFDWGPDGPPSQEFYSVMSEFFSEDYFDRVWTVQEMVLGTSALLQCGDLILDTDELASMVDLCHALTVLVMNNRRDVNASDLRSKAAKLRVLYTVRSAHLAIPDCDQIEYYLLLMKLAQNRGTLDPRDRVFGILGIAPSQLRSAMPIDVTHSVEQTYAQFMLCLLQNLRGGSCELLSYAGTVWRPSPLPSWCINFSSEPEFGRNPVRGPYEEPSSGKSPSLIELQRVDKGRNYKEIIVQGWRIDEISETQCLEWGPNHIEDPSADWYTSMAWRASMGIFKRMPQCIEMIRASGVSEEDAFDTFCRVVASEQSLKNYEDSVDMNIDWEALARRTKTSYVRRTPDDSAWSLSDPTSHSGDVSSSPARHVNDESIPKEHARTQDFGLGSTQCIMTDRQLRTALSEEWQDQMRELAKQPWSETGSSLVLEDEPLCFFGRVVARECHSFGFYTTTQGWMGLAPCLPPYGHRYQAVPGDVICLIFGCRTLTVLRPSPTQEGKYIVIGECFCLGLNYGEAEGLQSQYGWETESFTLV